MDPAAYVLIGAVVFFFAAIIAAGTKEQKGSLTQVAHDGQSVEAAEKRYQSHKKWQRIFIWIGVFLIVVAIATFIIPRWDNIQKNINRDKSQSGLIQH